MAIKTPNTVDRHIGLRIRARRNEVRMSQEKLGEALGVTFQQVQKYEKGVNRIGGSRMRDIATILQVPITYFYEGIEVTDGKQQPSLITEFAAKPYGNRLALAFMKLTSAQQFHVLRLVEGLSDDKDIGELQ